MGSGINVSYCKKEECYIKKIEIQLVWVIRKFGGYMTEINKYNEIVLRILNTLMNLTKNFGMQENYNKRWNILNGETL